jgi:hypothetical protein
LVDFLAIESRRLVVLVGRLACYRKLAAGGRADGRLRRGRTFFFGKKVAAGKRRREIARERELQDGPMDIFLERQFAPNLGSLIEQMSCVFSL